MPARTCLWSDYAALSRCRHHSARITDDLRCRALSRIPKVSCRLIFVSSGMQFYFYLAKIPIPIILGTDAVQRPELSGVRGLIHFGLFLVCLHFGWLSRSRRADV